MYQVEWGSKAWYSTEIQYNDIFLTHLQLIMPQKKDEQLWYWLNIGSLSKGVSVSVLLTRAIGRLTLQRHDLVFLFVYLHRQVGQVLLHLSGHLSIFVQLLSVEKWAATYSLLMGATLHIQHVGVGAALTQRPNEEKRKEEKGGKEGGVVEGVVRKMDEVLMDEQKMKDWERRGR